ncbi:hypothetical protein SFRURICE_004135 [Spodoptera frugiperda]|nr:hypothetical protein SFRURICE_004135 [Spodoptera frugiperda]
MCRYVHLCLLAEVHITTRNRYRYNCTPTFQHWCYKSHTPCYYREMFDKPKNAQNTLPDPGIESETCFPAVALPTTRPMMQNKKVKKILWLI